MRSSAWGVALVLLATAACVTRSAAVDPVSADGLDARLAADRQMQAFGEANLQCRMWSNWQRLCSRSGPNGSVQCQTDAARPVTPSRPFCAAGPNAIYGQNGRGIGDRRTAAERFCRTYQALPLEPGQRPVRLCTGYDPQRPFNGRRIASLRHPGCGRWNDDSTGALVCTESGDGAPSCGSLAASGYQHPHALRCSAWIGDAACHPYPISGPNYLAEGGIIILEDPDRRPVHGIYCSRR